MENYKITWTDVMNNTFEGLVWFNQLNDTLKELINTEGITSILVNDSKNVTVFGTDIYESTGEVPSLINENTTDKLNIIL